MKISMRSSKLGGILSLGLAIVFCAAPAIAHDTVPSGDHAGPAVTAGEVSDRDELKNFVLHAANHVSRLRTPFDISDFRDALARDGGDWRDEDLYLMLLDWEDGQVLVHGADRSVENRRLLSSEDTDDPHLRELRAAAREDRDGEGVCRSVNGEISCAVAVRSPLFGVDKDLLLVAGYDFRREGLAKLPFSRLPGADIASREGGKAAGDVREKEDLPGFLEEAIAAYLVFVAREICDFSPLADQVRGTDQFEGLFLRLLLQDPDRVKALPAESVRALLERLAMEEDFDLLRFCDLPKTGLFRPVLRSEDGPWRSGSVYVFSVTVLPVPGGPVLRGFINGLDPELEDIGFDVTDAGGRNVGREILRAVDEAKSQDPSATGAFVEYCWDDPAYDGDEVRDQNGNLKPGEAPGRSWKISYVSDAFAVLGLDSQPQVLFGSGIYPTEGTPPEGCELSRAGVGGGCAVAGSGSTPRGVAFGLLLTASALLAAVSFGNRARGNERGGVPVKLRRRRTRMPDYGN